MIRVLPLLFGICTLSLQAVSIQTFHFTGPAPTDCFATNGTVSGGNGTATLNLTSTYTRRTAIALGDFVSFIYNGSRRHWPSFLQFSCEWRLGRWVSEPGGRHWDQWHI